MDEQIIISCRDPDDAIREYSEQRGYRLDMIFPADSPREALMSRDGENLRLVASPKSDARGPKSQGDADAESETMKMGPTTENEWIIGRAGMEYRDLIPGRLDGKVIASHIRLTKGGEVPDYVHYHKIDFQMIYCKKGRIRVVYEDQGPPFWLETGDCVLQPPKIRHRVLECTAGAEVVEVSMPAEHETWVEHDITLPTDKVDRDRDFGGQRFLRHICADAEWVSSDKDTFKTRETGISKASNGIANVCVRRSNQPRSGAFGRTHVDSGAIIFLFVLAGTLAIRTGKSAEVLIEHGNSWVIPAAMEYALRAETYVEVLEVNLPA